MIDCHIVIHAFLVPLLLLLPILSILINIFDKLWHLVYWLSLVVISCFLIGIELLLGYFVWRLGILVAGLRLGLHVIRLFGPWGGW